MVVEGRIPKVRLAYSWPSLASASAELTRPRRSRVGRPETPAVPSLAPPASAGVGPGASPGLEPAGSPLPNGGGLQ
jgi:hypothetical protein